MFYFCISQSQYINQKINQITISVYQHHVFHSKVGCSFCDFVVAVENADTMVCCCNAEIRHFLGCWILHAVMDGTVSVCKKTRVVVPVIVGTYGGNSALLCFINSENTSTLPISSHPFNNVLEFSNLG